MTKFSRTYPGSVSGHICSGFNVELLDTAGNRIGYLDSAWADVVVNALNKTVEGFVVEYVTGEHIDTYWSRDYPNNMTNQSAIEAAMARVAHLKYRWGIDARIREV